MQTWSFIIYGFWVDFQNFWSEPSGSISFFLTPDCVKSGWLAFKALFSMLTLSTLRSLWGHKSKPTMPRSQRNPDRVDDEILISSFLLTPGRNLISAWSRRNYFVSFSGQLSTDDKKSINVENKSDLQRRVGIVKSTSDFNIAVGTLERNAYMKVYSRFVARISIPRFSDRDFHLSPKSWKLEIEEHEMRRETLKSTFSTIVYTTESNAPFSDFSLPLTCSVWRGDLGNGNIS